MNKTARLLLYMLPPLACRLCTPTLLLRKISGIAGRKASPAMGASASSSVTSKLTNEGENYRVRYASSTMQGYCAKMEHAFAVELDIDANDTSFFGVYDGQGGAEVAMYCAKRFHTMLCEDGDYLISLPIAIASVCFRLDDDLQRSNEWRESLYPRGNGDCFQFLGTGVCANLWRFIEATRYVGPLREGSTACVVIIRGNEITVGNVGDSRCVLSRNGQAINLSTDHKPNAVHEFLRIQRAGGQVLTNTVPVIGIGQGGLITRLWDVPRVQGKLAVSRVIGYFELKQNKNEPMVICVPDINAVDITDDTEFLVIASDGIWDHMSSQEVVDFVHKELHSGEENLRATCEKLLDHCLDSRDNVTVILVRFKPGPAVIPLLSDIEEEEPNEPQHNPEDSGQQHDGDEIIPYLSDIEDEPDEPQHNPQSPGQ